MRGLGPGEVGRRLVGDLIDGLEVSGRVAGRRHLEGDGGVGSHGAAARQCDLVSVELGLLGLQLRELFEELFALQSDKVSHRESSVWVNGQGWQQSLFYFTKKLMPPLQRTSKQGLSSIHDFSHFVNRK